MRTPAYADSVRIVMIELGGAFEIVIDVVERSVASPSVTRTSTLHICPGPRYDDGTVVALSNDPSLNPFLYHVMEVVSIESISLSEDSISSVISCCELIDSSTVAVTDGFEFMISTYNVSLNELVSEPSKAWITAAHVCPFEV
jgi:hypothetical protein